MNDERNPVDQLVELLVYAPIGLLYERDDVLPRLVTRGRNQVQLARVLGQLAVRRSQGQLEERLGEVFGSSGAGLAKLVTEVGAMLGLAPPPEGSGGTPGTAGTVAGSAPTVEPDHTADAARSVASVRPADAVEAEAEALAVSGAGTAAEEPPVTRRAPAEWSPAQRSPAQRSRAKRSRTARTSLPIAGYDQLRARDIIALLVDLSPTQRQAVRDHEAAHRGRTTILHQIDRLGT